MSYRPLAFVASLTLGDYVLWRWSLNANHDVLALVAGLTLPPLALACIWLLALSLLRAIARSSRREGATRSRAGRSPPARSAANAARGAGMAQQEDGLESASPTGKPPRSPGKLAA